MGEIEPQVAEMRRRRNEAVDALALGDGRKNGDEELHNGVLKDEDIHAPVKVQAVDKVGVFLLLCGWLTVVIVPSSSSATTAVGTIPTTVSLGLWDFQRGKVDFALAVGRRHKLAHHEKEVTQGNRLGKIEPWSKVRVRRGKGNLDKTANVENGQISTDAHNVELLVGA